MDQSPAASDIRRVREAQVLRMLTIIRTVALRGLLRGDVPLTPTVARELAAVARDVTKVLALLAEPLPRPAPEPPAAATH